MYRIMYFMPMNLMYSYIQPNFKWQCSTPKIKKSPVAPS